jgi:Uma2 family endonuclease
MATIEDLYREDGQAELVGGRIVRYLPLGAFPSTVAGNIVFGLRGHAKARGGRAYMGRLAYVFPALASGRESFSPDASYYDGPLPVNRMRFIEGVPNLAVEVRSENDYGDAAELTLAAKRNDYFEAGTLVVWDVDPIAETVTVYRASDPTNPVTFHRSDIADAESAMPGWRMKVDDVFEE